MQRLKDIKKTDKIIGEDVTAQRVQRYLCYLWGTFGLYNLKTNTAYLCHYCKD